MSNTLKDINDKIRETNNITAAAAPNIEYPVETIVWDCIYSLWGLLGGSFNSRGTK